MKSKMAMSANDPSVLVSKAKMKIVLTTKMLKKNKARKKVKKKKETRFSDLNFFSITLSSLTSLVFSFSSCVHKYCLQ